MFLTLFNSIPSCNSQKSNPNRVENLSRQDKIQLYEGLKMRKIEIGGQKEDKNQKKNSATLDFQEVTGFISAQNRSINIRFSWTEMKSE